MNKVILMRKYQWCEKIAINDYVNGVPPNFTLNRIKYINYDGINFNLYTKNA